MTDAKLREYEELANGLRSCIAFPEMEGAAKAFDLFECADALDALAAEVRAKGASVDRLLRALGEKEQRAGVLEGIVAKLPVTADGVRIVPGMKLWAVGFNGKPVEMEASMPWPKTSHALGAFCRFEDAYSTPEAAQAAAGDANQPDNEGSNP